MKKYNIFIFMLFLLLLSGCNNKEDDQKTDKHKVQLTEAQKKSDAEIDRQKFTFTIEDMNGTKHTIYLKNRHLEISNIEQELVLINLFAIWCPPCQGEVPYLSDLQKKYSKELFILGVPESKETDKKKLNEFIEKNDLHYFVSVGNQNSNIISLLIKRLHLEDNPPIPFSILFKNGKYLTHYEGAVPFEMLEHDIKTASNKEKE